MTIWATRRKTLYTGIFFTLLVLFVGVPAFLTFYTKPTCTDGIQNQDERGVDCGGKCLKLCPLDYASPVTVWETFTKVVPGIYNVATLLENPNLSVGSKPAHYIFKLYDKEGILIVERKGSTSVPVGSKFVVFENSLLTGERVPVRATFEFDSPFDWSSDFRKMLYRIDSVDISSNTNSTLVAGRIVSQGPVPFGKSEAVAVLYDKDGNVISFSKTILDSVYPNFAYPVSFTWPSLVQDTVVKTDIFVRPL